MGDEQACYIYVQLPGTMETVPCASLRVRTIGAGAFEGTFTYGKRYLERSEVAALDPFHLPLTTRPLRFTKLKGIPGAVRDASPDAWGRRVIQARLQRPEADIREVEYLLNGPDDGAGNLSFGRTVAPPTPHRAFNRTHRLPSLIEAAQKLEEDGRLPHEVLEELDPGTSLGGARPKVTIEDDRKLWLTKLPEKADRHNMQRIEFATLELARAAGLRVCTARLQRVGRREALMLERFDREWNPDADAYRRHGLVSGLTVLDAEDTYLGRDRWSYLLLADELRRWSARSNEDRRELFRRMAFNAMVTNNDDHPRNHALIHTQAGWRLSPAYDILPIPLVSLERRDLAMEVGRFGRAAAMYNVLSKCEAFGLTREAAQALVDAMLSIVRGWREFFAARGVDHRDITMLEQAILPPSFFLDQPPGDV
jgi:serine/threonine-protein kinase HipA